MEHSTAPESVRQTNKGKTVKIALIAGATVTLIASCLFIQQQSEPVAKAVRASKPSPVIPANGAPTIPSITTDHSRLRSTACEEELREFMHNDPQDVEAGAKGEKILGEPLYVTAIDTNAAATPYDHEGIIFRKIPIRYEIIDNDEQVFQVDNNEQWQLWYEKCTPPFKGKKFRPRIIAVEAQDTEISTRGKVLFMEHTTAVPYEIMRETVAKLINRSIVHEDASHKDRHGSFIADGGAREFFHIYHGPVGKNWPTNAEEQVSVPKKHEMPTPAIIEQSSDEMPR